MGPPQCKHSALPQPSAGMEALAFKRSIHLVGFQECDMVSHVTHHNYSQYYIFVIVSLKLMEHQHAAQSRTPDVKSQTSYSELMNISWPTIADPVYSFLALSVQKRTLTDILVLSKYVKSYVSLESKCQLILTL